MGIAGVTRQSKLGHIRKIYIGDHKEVGALFTGDGVLYKHFKQVSMIIRSEFQKDYLTEELIGS